MENEEDILNVEFDPSDLDNIDEDALLNETNTIPSLSPTLFNTGLGNSTESIVTSSVELTPVSAPTVAQPEPPAEAESTEHQISSTKSDDVDSKLSGPNSSEDEDESNKSSPHDKFKTEQTEVKPKRSAVDRANIPDSLDNVKVHGLAQSYNTKNYTARNMPRFDQFRRDYREIGNVERVFLNPHFKGSVHADSSNAKFLWDSQSNQNKSGQSSTLTSLMQPISSVIRPAISLMSMPPPTFPLIPIPMRPASNSPVPLSQAFTSQRPPTALVQSSGLKPLIDTSRPPPFLLKVAPIPEKAEWLGATEDFLKKIQSKETISSSRYSSNRHAADHIRRKYGVSNSQSAYESRRRSSTSTTKSQDDDVVKKSADNKVDESTILAKHGDICDESYLKRLAQQKILRETFLKRKEWHRQLEISKKQDSPSETKEPNVYSKIAETVDIKLTGKSQNDPSIAQKSVKSVKDRIVLRTSVPQTLDDRQIVQKTKQNVLERSKIQNVGNLPKITQTSPRRVVLPPNTKKRRTDNISAKNDKNNNEQNDRGPSERKLLRLGSNLGAEKSGILQKSVNSRKIALWTAKNRRKY